MQEHNVHDGTTVTFALLQAHWNNFHLQVLEYLWNHKKKNHWKEWRNTWVEIRQ